MRLLLLLVLLWNASPTPGVQYQLKELLSSEWKNVGLPVSTLSASVVAKRGTHTYAVVAVSSSGVESGRSNSVVVRVKK